MSEIPRTEAAWDESNPLHKLSDKERREVCAQLERELLTSNAIIASHETGDKMLLEMLGSETIAEGIEKLKRATYNSLPQASKL